MNQFKRQSEPPQPVDDHRVARLLKLWIPVYHGASPPNAKIGVSVCITALNNGSDLYNSRERYCAV